MAITVDKRDLLLASLDRQRLIKKGRTRDIVSSLLGLQAQFAGNPAHALRIRAADFRSGSWHHGLVKTWTFRHTLHVIRRDELGMFLAASSWGMPEEWDDRWGLDRREKPHWSRRLHDWIRSGAGDREKLKAKCREAGMERETMEAVFHGWGGLLSEMCYRGLIAYEPGTAKRFVACDGFAPMDREAARIEVLRRYFRFLGPATLQDCAAFTGLKMGVLTALLKKHPLPLKSAFCEGREYWYLGTFAGTTDIPPCLFLTGFDQLLLAYRDRTRLLDDQHKRDVITTTGILHPTILLNGRIQAKWKKNGRTIQVTPFVGLAGRTKRLIAEQAHALFGGDIAEVTFADV